MDKEDVKDKHRKLKNQVAQDLEKMQENFDRKLVEMDKKF